MDATHVIIVGGGIGGAAAALRAAQYHLKSVWLTGDRETHRASRAAYVHNIDNMIGVHPGIMLSAIGERLRADHPAAVQQLLDQHFHISTRDVVRNARARIETDYAEFVRIVDQRAASATRAGDRFRVTAADGAPYEADYLVLATGVMDRQPVVHRQRGGRDLWGIHWVFPYANHETLLYCIRCEGHLTAGRSVAVIGAGDAAAEVSLMIRERYGSAVSLLTAGESIAWSAERGRLLQLAGVTVHDGRLTEIHGDQAGARLHGFTLEGGARVDAEMAFVAMGLHRVYNELARSLGAALEGDEEGGTEAAGRTDGATGAPPVEKRHVLVDARGETSVANLFAVGDMARRRDEPMMKQIYTAQEYAVRAIDRIDWRRRRAGRDRLLRGDRPGI